MATQAEQIAKLVEDNKSLREDQKTILETLTAINSSLTTLSGVKDTVDKVQSDLNVVKDNLTAHKAATQAAFDEVNAKIDEKVAVQPQPEKITKPTLRELISRESFRLDRLIEEAECMEGTVIIGKQSSTPPEKYSEAFVRSTVSQLSGGSTNITPRGTTGVYAVSFKQVAGHTPATRARSFLSKLSSIYASRQIWAQMDRPRELREHDRRARAFARAFKSRVVAPGAPATAKPPVFFSVDRGYLIINDSVIGPVNLITDDSYWPDLNDLVLTLIRNPRRPKINYSRLLSAQLNKPIAELLYDAFTSIPDEFPDPADDGGDESQFLDLELDEEEHMPLAALQFDPNADPFAPLPRPQKS
jgi:hypothetical protein